MRLVDTKLNCNEATLKEILLNKDSFKYDKEKQLVIGSGLQDGISISIDGDDIDFIYEKVVEYSCLFLNSYVNSYCLNHVNYVKAIVEIGFLTRKEIDNIILSRLNKYLYN